MTKRVTILAAIVLSFVFSVIIDISHESGIIPHPDEPTPTSKLNSTESISKPTGDTKNATSQPKLLHRTHRKIVRKKILGPRTNATWHPNVKSAIANSTLAKHKVRTIAVPSAASVSNSSIVVTALPATVNVTTHRTVSRTMRPPTQPKSSRTRLVMKPKDKTLVSPMIKVLITTTSSPASVSTTVISRATTGTPLPCCCPETESTTQLPSSPGSSVINIATTVTKQPSKHSRKRIFIILTPESLHTCIKSPLLRNRPPWIPTYCN